MINASKPPKAQNYSEDLEVLVEYYVAGRCLYITGAFQFFGLCKYSRELIESMRELVTNFQKDLL